MLGDEHRQHVKHSEVSGGTHQEEATTGDVGPAGLHSYPKGV